MRPTQSLDGKDGGRQHGADNHRNTMEDKLKREKYSSLQLSFYANTTRVDSSRRLGVGQLPL